jgi:hypothetical protein
MQRNTLKTEGLESAEEAAIPDEQEPATENREERKKSLKMVRLLHHPNLCLRRRSRKPSVLQIPWC